MNSQHFVGIDVSLTALDVGSYAAGTTATHRNTDEGIRALLRRLQPQTPTPIDCEATSGIERPFVIACVEAGLPRTKQPWCKALATEVPTTN
ncbi:hypothetical protein [Deinococcus peraridilitoris]|uniref:Transposase n=1 Tax=Deinococcus peraridilitoris (strain DSM 19664 / LMG 22246 / CIP 109416 / KR-200) TaxID=937777 RepID=L0A367_DEIPD|nr:hypothetical protein [Deinococcus peraridilitoris]AFZ68291.1 hypothetical protein Deipe_2828 [Deinococcus peraridilitoris DSM 19664]